MTAEEMAEEYAHNHIHYEVAKREDGIEYAKEVSNVTIEQAYLAGVEAGRPKWHKVADGDLPKGNCENILLYNKDHFCVTHSYSLGYYENGVFYNDCEMEEDTIAWCEIPQYTED